MYSSRLRVTAVVLAGGIGSRMNSDTTKQRMLLGGISVLRRSVLAFENCDIITDIIVVARQEEQSEVSHELSDISKLRSVVVGGSSRGESALFGFEAVAPDTSYVAIHDAARPLVTPSMITAVVDKAVERGAATAASRIADTIKLINADNKIEQTLNRDLLVRATTPQVFEKSIYKKAIETNRDHLKDFTDDNMLVESIGEDVYAVLIEESNLKITTSDDLVYAELLLKQSGRV